MLTDDDLLRVMNEAFDRYDEEAVQTLDGRKLAIGRAVERAAYEAAAKVCESLENRVISTHPARIEFDPNSLMARKCAAVIRSLMTQEQPK